MSNSNGKQRSRFSSSDRSSQRSSERDHHQEDSSNGSNYHQSDRHKAPYSSSHNRRKQIDMKVFVGQIPKQWDDQDLKAYFEKFGDILKVQVLRDKNGSHKGCAFIIYASILSANDAIERLKNVKLPGMNNNVQINWADNEIDRLGIRQDQEHILYVATIPKNVTEGEIRDVFSKYGRVKEVDIPRDSQGLSRGYVFVKFSNIEESLLAKQGLHDTCPFSDKQQPIVIRFYDSKKKNSSYLAPTHSSSSTSGANSSSSSSRRDSAYPSSSSSSSNNHGSHNSHHSSTSSSSTTRDSHRRSRSRERSSNHYSGNSYTSSSSQSYRQGDDYYHDSHNLRSRDGNYQSSGSSSSYPKSSWSDRDSQQQQQQPQRDSYRSYDDQHYKDHSKYPSSSSHNPHHSHPIPGGQSSQSSSHRSDSHYQSSSGSGSGNHGSNSDYHHSSQRRHDSPGRRYYGQDQQQQQQQSQQQLPPANPAATRYPSGNGYYPPTGPAPTNQYQVISNPPPAASIPGQVASYPPPQTQRPQSHYPNEYPPYSANQPIAQKYPQYPQEYHAPEQAPYSYPAPVKAAGSIATYPNDTRPVDGFNYRHQPETINPHQPDIQLPPPQSSQPATGKVYYKYFTAEKIPYYYDTVTKETSYDIPPLGSILYVPDVTTTTTESTQQTNYS